MKLSEPHVIAPLWALVAIDHKCRPALIEYGPVEWWDEFMAGDCFIDVFDARLPEEAGVYWWHGHYRANSNAGSAMPNGEVDDWPGEWVGKWTKQELPK